MREYEVRKLLRGGAICKNSRKEVEEQKAEGRS